MCFCCRCCLRWSGGLGLAFLWGRLLDRLRPYANTWLLRLFTFGVYTGRAGGACADNVCQLGAFRLCGIGIGVVGAGLHLCFRKRVPKTGARWAPGNLQPASHRVLLAAADFITVVAHFRLARDGFFCAARTGDPVVYIVFMSGAGALAASAAGCANQSVCVRFLFRAPTGGPPSSCGPPLTVRIVGLLAGQSDDQQPSSTPGEALVHGSAPCAARVFDGHDGRCCR